MSRTELRYQFQLRIGDVVEMGGFWMRDIHIDSEGKKRDRGASTERPLKCNRLFVLRKKKQDLPLGAVLDTKMPGRWLLLVHNIFKRHFLQTLVLEDGEFCAG